MSIDYRAELQRLVQAYDDHGGRWPQHHENALDEAVEAARTTLAQTEPQAVGLTDGTRTWLPAAALAQPEPQGPTDEGIQELFWKHSSELGDVRVGVAVEDAPAFIRAALACWGRPAIEPVPQQEPPK
jgi:hypothetical protein